MNLSSYNLGILKGYLIAVSAPKEIIAAAEALILPPERVENSDVHLPKAFTSLPEQVQELSLKAPSHDESRFAAPETPQGEVKRPVSATRDAPEPKDLSLNAACGWTDSQRETLRTMRAEGKTVREIAAAIGRTVSQTREMSKYLRRREHEVRERVAAGLPPAKPNLGSSAKLTEDQLPEIRHQLATKTFAEVGSMYGVTGQSIVNFLRRHGVDHRQYKKYSSIPKPDSEDWPEPVRPERIMPLAEKPEAENPRMKFRRMKTRDSWGNEKEVDVPVPVGKYKDPDTGAKVTKYPPGYAWGTHEQKNVSVKGGS